MDKYSIPHELFQLELTETAYMDNPQVMEQVVAGLKENGFTVMMDDFGSGYSSLNMLKEMDKEWDEFQVLNTITIAGTWDISKNYPKYAIVEDSGTGYMAIKPVPAGIAINNLPFSISGFIYL